VKFTTKIELSAASLVPIESVYATSY